MIFGTDLAKNIDSITFVSELTSYLERFRSCVRIFSSTLGQFDKIIIQTLISNARTKRQAKPINEVRSIKPTHNIHQNISV